MTFHSNLHAAQSRQFAGHRPLLSVSRCNLSSECRAVYFHGAVKGWIKAEVDDDAQIERRGEL
jgi:hypothetical protein